MKKFQKQIDGLQAHIDGCKEHLVSFEAGVRWFRNDEDETDKWAERFRFDIERYGDLIALYQELEVRPPAQK